MYLSILLYQHRMTINQPLAINPCPSCHYTLYRLQANVRLFTNLNGFRLSNYSDFRGICQSYQKLQYAVFLNKTMGVINIFLFIIKNKKILY